jgi:hypothetical protein
MRFCISAMCPIILAMSDMGMEPIEPPLPWPILPMMRPICFIISPNLSHPIGGHLTLADHLAHLLHEAHHLLCMPGIMPGPIGPAPGGGVCWACTTANAPTVTVKSSTKTAFI